MSVVRVSSVSAHVCQTVQPDLLMMSDEAALCLTNMAVLLLFVV